MPYPSTVDTGQQPPWFLANGALLAPADFFEGAGALVANVVYLADCYLPTSATLPSMRITHGGVAAGNLDMGIYDNNGNLMGHTGVVACNGVSLVQSVAFSGANINLSAGAYYLALWADNATDTYYYTNTGANTTYGNFVRSVNTVLGGLPANFAAMGGVQTSGAKFIQFIATIQGRSF